MSRNSLTYYVDSTKVSGLKKGMQIRFTSTKELSKPRIITGSIKEVAKSATAERDGNVFLVKASLYPKVKDKRTLIYGMQGRVSSIIDKKTFFNYYKDKLFGSE
ncbi:HlyD family efflux transporter periplasmic adaptor subunit [Lactococcus piscium]|uniref:HlyD family efflux transporter periplasmic adaptor subunit n=2 Tax=Pseudolactococcus carnosus TaxID=2749961 RepID=UPI00117A94B9|nr:HlyD family efflux transporter periplasmic adaptor subunit [Lactococcus carnosus]MCJ1974942.1 HlyD family efflux transporter periplasmic adaptor subunit [Lactococcus carnosus]MCJ1985187.1 HlyD family efflux transporter periplasmic adaptor subunit [Lactococcus carnosus]MCJ1991735.1 HlyD family efflux transporter periplasmic adaptor subunit [Lactococcus carnosus]